MKTKPYSLIALFGIAVTIAAITYAATPQETGCDTVEKQILAQTMQTNELLVKIHETLVEMNLPEQQKKTTDLLTEMNRHLGSIDEKIDRDSQTLELISTNINNSKNPVCVLEQLEDIKTALNSLK